ncbi:MaoC family dehydratase [Rhizobium halophytocola]|uniref:Acyl dehydratase n=1 Tax=Rhizobium halophytocola TaxID=735519 RepID=A0ABS4E3S5_9HYPH|nr:MaoC family dehydratase [Rhizobium halophytocola]MBP1852600.1 acyl dehydratase [Rhizobium halophytocola]
MATLYFEDFELGRVFEFKPKTVTAEEIVAFASEFDPQPMHISESAGQASILGGLSASGWHTSCLLMQMMIEAYVLQAASEGAPGIEDMAWKRPVLAGDTLSGRSKVLAARALRSRPGIGIVNFTHQLENQNGQIVLQSENPIMMRLRPGTEAG